MLAPQKPGWAAADRQIPNAYYWSFLDDQIANHTAALATFGWAGGLDVDDGAVARLAQIDDLEVVEIEQTQQVNIFHRLLHVGVNNNHAKPREAQAKPVGGRPDPARSTRPQSSIGNRCLVLIRR